MKPRNMKWWFAFIIGLLLMGCHLDNTLRSGTYKSPKYSILTLGLLRLQGFRSAYIGCDIVLNGDSTCSYTTCGCIMSGKWFHKGDSMFLVITANRWKSDSLNMYGYNGKQPVCPAKPVGFAINGDYIERVHVLKNGDKILEKLEFTEPQKSS